MYVVLGAITTTLALGLMWGQDEHNYLVLDNPGGEMAGDDFTFASSFSPDLPDDVGLLLHYDTKAKHELVVYVTPQELSSKGHQKLLKFMPLTEVILMNKLSEKQFHFKLVEKGDNTFMFESYAYPGEVIDVEASREEPGTPLIIYPRHDGPNQIFKSSTKS